MRHLQVILNPFLLTEVTLPRCGYVFGTRIEAAEVAAEAASEKGGRKPRRKDVDKYARNSDIESF